MHFSDIKNAVDFTMIFILSISVILLIGITVMMVSFVIRYRKSRHPVPAKVKHHAFLEILWTAIPTLIALVMFYYGWVGYRMMRFPPPGAMEVTAIAQMWSWQFEYENGKRNPELIVPVNQPVKVNLMSRDVLHSFYAPAFRIKQDVVPGQSEFVWFESKEIGEFDIFCAEYCGQRHSYMLSKINVMSEAEFAEWIVTDVPEPEPEDTGEVAEEERISRLVRLGERLSRERGCNACHTIDGTQLVGPTYKGLFGKTERVVTDGTTREVVVDEAYLRHSILDPAADVVEGFQPLMPPQQGLLSDNEIDALIEYIKTL